MLFVVDYFTMPVNKCPFSNLVGQRHHVYYSDTRHTDMCKGDDTSIVMFTQSDITFNTCTDSYSYG